MSHFRVRFAPSPTGPLHIGGVRTALYNYLFAKKHNGTFILRIEDTDQTRFVSQAQDYIIESLKWCGISPDEGAGFGGEKGPYVQSERKSIYKEYIDQLIRTGKAYLAFDTPEELENKRNVEKENGNANWQYDSSSRMSMRNSLSHSTEEVENLIKSGANYTVRLKIEAGQQVVFDDMIRGRVHVQTDVLDDKILFKSDGLPTYHFANIVDDHLMEISHVIRGEEWLPSTALHCLLYDAMGWERPIFAHLPLILKPDGKGKLSKRDGDKLGFPVFPLNWTNNDGEIYPGFREQGYDARAFVNMLAFLGWNPGTEQEIFSMDELIQAFSFEKVNNAGARFDVEKTKWFQQQYIKALSDEELLTKVREILPANLFSQEQLLQICSLMKERITFPAEIISEGSYFFEQPEEFDEKTTQKKWKDNSADLLLDLIEVFSDITFEATIIEQTFKAFLEKKEVGLGQVMPVLRLALTGKGGGPQLFEIMAILGKEVCTERLKNAISIIENKL